MKKKKTETACPARKRRKRTFFEWMDNLASGKK